MLSDNGQPLSMQADALAQKVRHHLISTMGRTSSEASDSEFYRAFCSVLREEIMVNWTATAHTLKQKGQRRVYYLSMEYMPGRLLEDMVSNLGKGELISAVLKKMNRDSSKIMHTEPDVGIGNGGLGRLASCFLDSLATQKYPALGYGMRYEYGIFEQELWCGVQVERPDCWLLNENPWEFRRDSHAQTVKYCGRANEKHNAHGETVYDISDAEEVRALPYDFPIVGYNKNPDFSVLTMRLWSTKASPRNFQLQRFNAGQFDRASENTSLTDVLYPNDNHDQGKRIRLKQEFLLVSASLQDIFEQYQAVYGEDFTQFGDYVRIQINDTHPALTIVELLRMLMHYRNMPWSKAWEIVQATCSYTNHTILKEALEEWNEERFTQLLPRQHNFLKRIDEQLMREARSRFPNDEPKCSALSIFGEGQIRMANLAIYGSHKVNGVAQLHADILKKSIFKNFVDFSPEKVIGITNGVTQRRWLLNANPGLAQFITERIGDGWITDFRRIRKLAEFADDPASLEAFAAIKKENKERLLPLVFEQLHKRFCGEQCDIIHNMITTDALFDVQIKRVHEYKRQLMKALHALMLYRELKDNIDAHRINRLILFGGKAAPGYEKAKNIIRLIYCLARVIDTDEAVGSKIKVVYIENYNVSKAEKMIPAANLSEQISFAGMEASGTGNMKLSMNGALTIGTDDGANVEMRQEIGDAWWPFKFGATAEENMALQASGSYKPQRILEQYPDIKQMLEMLRDGSLVENDAEHEALMSIYNELTTKDAFMVLNDLPSYYATQKNVEELYRDQNRWNTYAIHNIAGMGKFSSDESIRKYAENVWDVSPVPVDHKKLAQVREEFNSHDRCRIISSSGG